MHVDDVELAPVRQPPRRAHSRQHIKRGHHLVANRAADAVYGALIVREIFPAAREVAKPMNRNALEFVVAAAAVGGREHFDLESGSALAPEQLDEPGSDDVPGGARKCRNHMEDAH